MIDTITRVISPIPLPFPNPIPDPDPEESHNSNSIATNHYQCHRKSQ